MATVDEQGFVYDDRVNSFDHEQLHKHFEYVFGVFNKSLRASLGPGGASTIIVSTNEDIPVSYTKDGYAIMKELRFGEQVDHFISEMIKDLSKRINDKVGDSTTSVILIANALYRAISAYDFGKEYNSQSIMPPISKRLLLDIARKVITNEIRTNGKSIITSESLKDDKESFIRLMEQVAMCSSNNNKEITKNVVRVYEEKEEPIDVMISAEIGYGDDTVVETDVGFRFGNGFIHKSMVNQPDGITCKLDNPRFLLIDGILCAMDLPALSKIIQYCILTLKQPLVIIAREYDKVVMQELVKLTTARIDEEGMSHPKLPIAALVMDTSTEMSYTRFEDLKLLLNCYAISTKKGKIDEDIIDKNDINSTAFSNFIINYLGQAESYKGYENMESTIKIGKRNHDHIKARINELYDLIDKIKDEHGEEDSEVVRERIVMVRKQISMIRSDISVIRIGGSNKRERENKRKIYEDVIRACDCAANFGFTIGGNVSIVWTIDNKLEDLIEKIYKEIKENEVHIVVGNDETIVKGVIKDFLLMIRESFTAAYAAAIGNMIGEDTEDFKNVTDVIYKKGIPEPIAYNLVTDKFFSISEAKEKGGCSPVAPANTDTELMRAVFDNVGNVIGCNQIMALIPGKVNAYASNQRYEAPKAGKGKVYGR